MFDKMKELMEMKKQAEQLKRELDASTIEVTEVRGIRLVVNGSQDFQILEIDPTLLNPENKKRFEADLLRTLNSAMKKSRNVAAQKMKSMTGLNIPGL